jgi:hypothetical protein
VRAGESVDRGSELAIRVKFENGAVSTEKNFAPAALAREADVGERDRVTVAIAADGGVFKVRFECDERGRVPMLAPFDAGRLIELEFVFQSSRTRGTISGCESQATICASARTRARPRASRGSSGGFGYVSSRYSIIPATRTGSVRRRRSKREAPSSG